MSDHRLNPRRQHASWTVWLWLAIALGGASVTHAGGAEPIDMHLEDANLRHVLASLATIGGVEPVIDAEVQGTLTVSADNEPWTSVLDRICAENSLHCTVLGEAPAELYARPAGQGYAGFAEGISMSLERAKLAKVLESMVVISQGKLTLEGEFHGEVTVDLKGVPWSTALGKVCAGTCTIDWRADPVVVRPRSQP